MDMNIDYSIIRGQSDTFPIGCIDEAKQPVPFEPGDKVYLIVKTGLNDDAIQMLERVATEFINGEAVFEFGPEDEDMINIPYGSYYFGVTWERGDEKIPIISRGLFNVIKGIIKK